MLSMLHTIDQVAAMLPEAPPVPHPTATTPPSSNGLLKILGWVLWGVMALCVVGVMVGGAKLAMQHSRGEEIHGVKGVVLPLIGAVVAAGAASLVTAVLT